MRNALEWVDDHLEIIDQTVLPHRLEIRKLASVADVADAIRSLAVRGAPAIGVCGAFGVVLGIDAGIPLSEIESELVVARPTGANLARAVRRVIRGAATRDQALA